MAEGNAFSDLIPETAPEGGGAGENHFADLVPKEASHKDLTFKPSSATVDEAKEGYKEFESAFSMGPDAKKFGPIQSPLDVAERGMAAVGGGARMAASPFTGLARAYGGDALRGEGDNHARTFGANLYEDVAGLLGGSTEAKAAKTLADLGVRGTEKIGELYSKATGKVAGKNAEILRANTLEDAGAVAAQRQAEASTYQKKLDAVEAAQKQLGGREGVVEGKIQSAQDMEERALRQAHRTSTLIEQKEEVLKGIRERVRTAEQGYVEAGHSVEQAKKLAALDEQKIVDAETAVSAMERDFLSRPQATPEQFGQSIRQTTKELHDKYTAAREEQSGYKAAIESSGDVERVHTSDIIKDIDTQMKGIRNPSLEATLNHVKGLLKTEDRNALTLRSTESLRKYLDSIIRSKTVPTANGPMAVDSEALHYVSGVKKQLMKEATESWQPYREALGRWRTLSRPLDIVERKGALRKVLDTDPVSTDYALTESQVVGQVLSQAKAGNPVFTRLISESPELRDAARLHFTRDLFGTEAVPNEARLRTWLKANEGSLKQLGLYDEFRDIRVAKETASKAVADAKAARTMSLDEVRAAEKAERVAAEQMRRQASLRDKQSSRIEISRRTSETPDDIRKASDLRARDAEKRLGREESEARAGQESALGQSEAYQKFESDIQVARPKEVPNAARAFVRRELENGIITHNQYKQALRDIQKVEDSYSDIKQARAQILKIAKTIGVGTAAAFGLQGLGVLP